MPNPPQTLAAVGLGGAVSLDGQQLHLSLVLFEANTAGRGSGGNGGAVGLQECSDKPIIENCTFMDNVAGGSTENRVTSAGGAVSSQYCAIVVRDCHFFRNAAGGDGSALPGSGGALNIQDGTMHNSEIVGCVFVGNVAKANGVHVFASPAQGGAVSVSGANASFVECQFSSNIAQGSGLYSGGFGGALFVIAANHTEVSGCTFDNNTVLPGAHGTGCFSTGCLGGAVFASFGGRLHFNNTLFQNNRVPLSHNAGGAAIAVVTRVFLTVNASKFVNNAGSAFGATYRYTLRISELTDQIFLENNSTLVEQGNSVVVDCSLRHYCFACHLNSSCGWDDTCIPAANSPATCCPSSCHGNGHCDPMTGVCSCSWAFRGSSCGKLSGPAIASISGSVFGFAVIVSFAVVFCHRRRMAANTDKELASLTESLMEKFTSEIHPACYINSSEIAIKDDLGAGAFGAVRLGIWRGSTVAVKTLSVSELTQSDIDAFQREAFLLSTLRHPNIVLFMGMDGARDSLCIVMEHCEHGSLYDCLHSDVPLPWQLRLSMACDAAQGMTFLHAVTPKPIIHRDLKSHNILLDRRMSAKIGDFGLSRLRAGQRTSASTERTSSSFDRHTGLSSSTTSPVASAAMTAFVGTPRWAAPELLIGVRVYDESVDVYSFGIVLYEICSRRRPYQGLGLSTVRDLKKHVLSKGRPVFPDPSPEVYSQLAQECWCASPTPIVETVAGVMTHEIDP